MIKKKIVAGGVAVASSLLVLGATPAFSAPDVTYKSAVRAWGSGSTINVSDLKCDDKGTQAQYQRSGTSDVAKYDQKDGCGATKSKPAGGTVLQVKACIIYTFSGDDCSGWKS